MCLIPTASEVLSSRALHHISLHSVLKYRLSFDTLDHIIHPRLIALTASFDYRQLLRMLHTNCTICKVRSLKDAWDTTRTPRTSIGPKRLKYFHYRVFIFPVKLIVISSSGVPIVTTMSRHLFLWEFWLVCASWLSYFPRALPLTRSVRESFCVWVMWFSSSIWLS